VPSLTIMAVHNCVAALWLEIPRSLIGTYPHHQCWLLKWKLYVLMKHWWTHILNLKITVVLHVMTYSQVETYHYFWGEAGCDDDRDWRFLQDAGNFSTRLWGLAPQKTVPFVVIIVRFWNCTYRWIVTYWCLAETLGTCMVVMKCCYNSSYWLNTDSSNREEEFMGTSTVIGVYYANSCTSNDRWYM
jgi:hypothetical protein